MDLTSCDSCGIVLDKNKLRFDSIWEEDEYGGQSMKTSAYYDGENYYESSDCPVCGDSIPGKIVY